MVSLSFCPAPMIALPNPSAVSTGWVTTRAMSWANCFAEGPRFSQAPVATSPMVMDGSSGSGAAGAGRYSWSGLRLGVGAGGAAAVSGRYAARGLAVGTQFPPNARSQAMGRRALLRVRVLVRGWPPWSRPGAEARRGEDRRTWRRAPLRPPSTLRCPGGASGLGGPFLPPFLPPLRAPFTGAAGVGSDQGPQASRATRWPPFRRSPGGLPPR